MRSAHEIRDELEKVLETPQLKSAPATIQVNAPLALIQLSLETRRDTLRWVLHEMDAP